MPTPVNLPNVTIRTQGFMGGVNIRDAVNLMAPNETRPMENIVLDERGGGSKRRGTLSVGPFGTANARVLSMYTFMRGAVTPPQVLIHTTDGKLLYTTAPDANPVVWAQAATGLSTTVPLSYETYIGKCYMGNGIDHYCSWDGATFTPFPSAPRGKYHRLWKERMWISGVTGLNDRIYASDEGTAEVFTISNWVDIAAGDGDHIRALATDGQFLVVGKREMTHVIYDPVEFFNRVVDFEKGFESHFAVAHYDAALYFISRRGICQYLGDSPSVVLSERIDPVFIPDFAAIDLLEGATSYTFLNRIGFTIPETGSNRNSFVIEYYPRLGSLSMMGSRMIGPFSFHRMPVHCFTRWRWGQSDILFAGHNQANKMVECFAPVGTDDGEPFQAVLQTAWFDFSAPLLTKYLRELRLLCGGRFQVLIYRNFEESVYRTITVDASGIQDIWNVADDKWGEGNWGKNDPVRDIRKTNIDAYGRYFSFRFQDSFETDTNFQTFWIGSHGRDLTVGEWAIYGLVADGTVLGKRP